MSRLIRIYAVCKILLLSPVAAKELNRNTGHWRVFIHSDICVQEKNHIREHAKSDLSSLGAHFLKVGFLSRRG